jgi:formylmethanofuran dehydrogenase subunit E
VISAVDEAIARLAPLHDHVCPRQVLGVRIGLHAAALLGAPVPQADKRLVAFVETDGCFADAVTAATGCSLGHKTMRLVDHGKVAAVLLDTATGRAVRVWPHEQARAWAAAFAPNAPDRWHAQLAGYRTMPAETLLRSAFVAVAAPRGRSPVHPPPRVACAACGEEVMNGREVVGPEGVRCRACVGERYWSPVDAGGSSAGPVTPVRSRSLAGGR